MSFILDALRKSEHDRQREKGPALAEVAVASPRPKSNVWAVAAIALLLVNLVGVGVLLLHRARTPAAEAASGADAGAPAAAATVAPPPATSAATPQASVTQTLPQPQLREPPPASHAPERNPLEREVAGQPDMESTMAARAASVPAGPPAVSRTTAPQRGSVVYESLPEAVAQEAIAAEPPAVAPSQARLPNAGDAAASGGMPNLHLDLHVYSPRPQERFVFVNSHKYREGDTLAEGPVIEQITPSGAVLSYRGNRFILTSN